MPKLRALVVSAALIALAGCGEPRLDATNKETLKASMNRMTAGMDEQEKRKFGLECMAAAGPDMMKDAMQKGMAGQTVDETTVFGPLHGMTVSEIRAKAAKSSADAPKPAAR